MRNPARNRLGKLFDLVTTIGIDLPAAVTEAVAREDALKDAAADTRRALAVVPSDGQLTEDLFAAAQVTPAYLERLSSALSDRPRLERQERQLSVAIEMAESATVTAVHHAADDIIIDLLQPTLSEIVEAVRPHAEAAERVPWHDHDAAMLLDDDDARQAYRTTREQAKRYAALREALRILWLDADNDATQLFGEMKNLRSIWPGHGQRGPGMGPAPWASMTGPQRLNWLVNNAGADLWCPTLDEVEKIWQEYVAAHAPKKARLALGVFGGS